MKSLKGQTLKLVAALFAIAAVIMIGFFGIRFFEKTVIQKADDDILADVSKVDGYEENYIYNGDKAYKPKTGITSILLIGLDTEGKLEQSESYNNSEQCDFVTLLIFNEKTKQCNLIQFNRDTMTEMNVLGLSGEKAGTTYGQLALSHTYGTGMNDSARNTLKAVENLLFGTEIDYYICCNMSAVSTINDMVGGVTLEVLDDFEENSALVKGETVTLKGNLALTYVRGRKGAGDQTNIARMARQKQYMTEFTKQLKIAYAENENFVLEAYNAISNYSITDCSINKMSELSKSFSEYEINEIIIPEGESVEGEEFMEYWIDDFKLKDLVIELFYDEVKTK